MRTLHHTVFALVLLSLFCATPARAETYTVGVVPWAGCIPAIIAEHKGFWQAEGLRAKAMVFNDMLMLEKMLYGGKLDLLYHMLAAAAMPYLDYGGAMKTQQTQLRRAASVIIAETDWSHGGDKIIIKNDSDPALLRNKVVGVYLAQASILHFLGTYLEGVGVSPKQVKLIETDSASLSDNFIKGTFSAIVNFDPDALRAEQQGNGKVVATSADYPGVIPEGLMMLKTRFEATPQEDLVKLLRGWFNALQWMQDPTNRAEVVELAGRHLFRQADFNAEMLDEMLAGVRFHDPSVLRKRNIEDGTSGYFKELQGFLRRNGWLREDFSPAAVFDKRAVTTALGQ